MLFRSAVSPHLWATDATPSSGGATVATVPGKIARALNRVCEQKGSNARLDDSLQAELAVDRLRPRSPEVDQLISCLDWSVASQYVFRETAHINLQDSSPVMGRQQAGARLHHRDAVQ